ncbi:11996_t:CDS:2 [Entrophospora sp. SA101]|nr:11996_t:CDS:2 [Entrophospora sp. SA101]
MSTFGNIFRVTTYGESHGKSVGCIVDGCPPGLPLIEADIQKQLSRRRPDEKDLVVIQSGTEFGITLGTPIGLLVPNQDQRPHDYSETDLYPRPSHADWTYLQKYGVKASSGGGRASARETIGRVAAGAIAEKYLKMVYNIDIVAFVSSVSNIKMPFIKEIGYHNNDDQLYSQDFWIFQCPDKEISVRMTQCIIKAKKSNDSVGGTVTCVIRNVPSGLGEPCFDKLEAKLAHAMFSIPLPKDLRLEVASKVQLYNNVFGTKTNHSGGIQGESITNGENIYFRVAIKPSATISQE